MRQQARSAIDVSCNLHEVVVRNKKGLLQWEKLRRSCLQAIIHLIQRQSVFIARKRSAVVSIFFVDFPFLAFRLWLWTMLGHSSNMPFPGFGVKNGICIVLNVMQFPLVVQACRDSYMGIQRQLAAYALRFHSGAAAVAEATVDAAVQAPGSGSGNSMYGTPFTPLEAGLNALSSTPRIQRLQKQLPKAERQVRWEMVPSTSICAHFWALLGAFLLGFLLAKGEAFMARLARWVIGLVA